VFPGVARAIYIKKEKHLRTFVVMNFDTGESVNEENIFGKITAGTTVIFSFNKKYFCSPK